MKKFVGKIKAFFNKVKNGFGHFFARFKGLNTLVIIQLKDKLNMSFKADKKGTLTKLILKFVLFVVVTAAIVILFSILDRLTIFGSTTNSFPIPLFNLIFTAMLILSIFTCIASLTKSLYFSRDNLTLLSYPVNANTVFLSKLVVYYIVSLIREAAFILPLFLAYGIAYGFSLVYFPWVIFLFLIICLIPVAIASIVSIPWMFISMFFRKHPLAQDIGILLLLIVASVFLFIGIDMIPSNLHFLVKWSDTYYPQVLGFAQNLEHWLYPFFAITSLVTGANFDTIGGKGLPIFTNQTGPILGILVGSILVLILLAYFFAKPLFFKMAAKPFEFNKKIIFHNYNEPKRKVREEYYKYAFVPQEALDKTYSKKEKAELSSKFEKVLNLLNRDEKIFGKTVSEKRILRLLKSYTKMEFQVVEINDFVENNMIGFMIKFNYEIPTLVLAKSKGINSIYCYDPNYLIQENHPKTAFFSMMWKDILMGIRTPGTLMADYLLMIVGPLSVALMNKLFQSINTSFMGDQYVIMFNILIIVMIPLVSNVSMASIYSREGESSYLLKASPSNYIKTLTSKLVLRWFLITLSLVATTIVFDHYCDIIFNKPILLFFTVLFIYTGHLIWSAELDYMNPQDRLYKEVGEGNISNSNENVSGILAFVITALIVVISLILLKEDATKVFYKLFFIASLFLIARVLLAMFKIKGYRTSRGERGRD